jgi:hypothetical protein
MLVLPSVLTLNQATACLAMLEQGFARANAGRGGGGCVRAAAVRLLGIGGAAGLSPGLSGRRQDVSGSWALPAAGPTGGSVRCGGPAGRLGLSARPLLAVGSGHAGSAAVLQPVKYPVLMPAISFQSVSKTFAAGRGGTGEPLKALDDVSFDIEEGEFFGLLGPNGAGKTTLISILAGLTRATRGRVLVQGQRRAGGLRAGPAPARRGAPGTGVRPIFQCARSLALPVRLLWHQAQRRLDRRTADQPGPG